MVKVCALELVNHFEEKACPEKSMSNSTDQLDMTLTVLAGP